MYRGDMPGYVVLDDGTVFAGYGFGIPGERARRGGVQHRHDRLSRDGDRPFLPRADGHLHLSHDRQLRRLRPPARVRRGPLPRRSSCGKSRTRPGTAPAPMPGWTGSPSEASWASPAWIPGRSRRRIREHGAMTACVAAGHDLQVDDLLVAVRSFPGMAGRDLASAVTCIGTVRLGRAAPTRRSARFRVVAYDFGLKRSILRNLAAVGCRVTVVPAHWTAEQTLAMRPDGVFLSNGPGDPAAVGYAVDTIRGLLGKSARCSGSAWAISCWRWPSASRPTSSSSATGASTTRCATI